MVLTSATMLLPQGMRLRGPLTAVGLVSIAAILVVYLTPLNDRFAASNVTSFELAPDDVVDDDFGDQGSMSLMGIGHGDVRAGLPAI